MYWNGDGTETERYGHQRYVVTVWRLNGTDISVTDEFVTDGGDVTTVGGEDTGVIRDSHWRDA